MAAPVSGIFGTDFHTVGRSRGMLSMLYTVSVIKEREVWCVLDLADKHYYCARPHMCKQDFVFIIFASMVNRIIISTALGDGYALKCFHKEKWT